VIVTSVALAVLALVLFASTVWATQDRLLRRRIRDRVIVTLKSGAAFTGALHEVDRRTIVLRNAKALTAADGTAVPVDGELLVSRCDVDYLQRP
jgi:small nuclear ribonucleoprotein (snRNP)-like protein